jgi:predicted lipid-binding transport protein (Tim44 family)
MAADLIVYAIVAAALVFWLKSILGTKNGEERERDNPFAPKNDNRPGAGAPNDGPPLPDLAHAPIAMRDTGPDPLKINKATLMSRVRIETPGAEAGLRTVAAAMPGFTLEKFLDGAEYAFELIVTSFAKGDRTTLKSLLAPSVYNDFDAAITDRAARGETVETKIEAVRGMDLISATLKGQTAFISLRFTAQETCIIRDASGAITAGSPDQATTMIDIWTFGRDVSSNDPTWFLYETRDERAEPHKTPVPESY